LFQKAFRKHAVLMYAAVRLWAQGLTGPVLVKGEIDSAGRQLPAPLTVELLASGHGSRFGHALVSPDGSFAFQDVPPGQYELRITNAWGDLVARDFVSVNGASGPLVVRLPGQPANPPPGDPVSVGRLIHPIPRKAQQEFERSHQDVQRGRLQSSIRHLQRAVEIAPDYVEAYNNLGAQYIALNDYERAIQHLQTAIRLDSSSVPAKVNLSLALCLSKRCGDAEPIARDAVRIAPGLRKAHYVLGLILAAEDDDPPGALDHLEKSAVEFPNAHLVAARILVRHGDARRAVTQLRDYLAASPQARNREQIQSWLAALEH
jgi:tetratricopeptide (TPR) repeat protein